MAAKTTGASASTEIEATVHTLASLNNIDDALAYIRAQGDVVLASEMGDNDGYEIVLDKSRLVGTRMAIVGAEPFTSDRFGEGVVLRFLSAGGFKGKIVDFGTGIKEQILGLVENRPNLGGIVCEHGLVASTYGPKLDDDGNEVRPGGTTYYLDTAPASTGHIN